MAGIETFLATEQDEALLAQFDKFALDLKDDNFDYSKVVVRKPWGYEYLIFQNDHVAVWILYLKKDEQTSMHCHPTKKTSLIVLQGEVECSSIDGPLLRKVAEGVCIHKGAFHQTKAVSEKGAFVMEIETPVNKRDLIRLKDQYGRVGQGYESSKMHSRNTQNYNYLSFNGVNAAFCPKKRFGNCSITFKRLLPQKQYLFEEYSDNDIVSVVCGYLKSEKQGEVLGVGTTRTVSELRGTGYFCDDSFVDVIIVRRVDTDIKISDLISRILKEFGVQEVFVVPGDANVHLLDSLGREEEISCAAFQSESGASLAVEGWSKLTGKLGVLVLSSGGSVPRALPGISNAWIDSVPVVIISGQARSDQLWQEGVRQFGNKSLNIVDVVKPVTKLATQVTDPKLIKRFLFQAIDEATRERRGPCWLDIPIDILGATVDERDMEEYIPLSSPKRSRLREEVHSVIEELKKCRRPVLLAGYGIESSGGRECFNRLIEKLCIPVLTTRRGADLLPESHPYFIGRPGTFGQRRANFALQNADLLLNIGSRLSIPLIGRDTAAFAREAFKISVDIDTAELQKESVKVNLPIQADAHEFMTELLEEVQKRKALGSYEEWWNRCNGWKRDFPPLSEGYSHGNSVNPYLLLRSISKNLREGEIVVLDGGPIMHCATQVFEYKERQRLICSSGLELAGGALPSAVGSAIAASGRRVICLCEERGFQNGLSELQTIIAYQLPVLIFVLKSQSYSSVRSIQREFFGSRYVGTEGVSLSPHRIVDLGRAYGFRVAEITSGTQMEDKVQEFLAHDDAGICSVEVESDQELIPRMGFAVKDDGKWIPRPLEDMYPFLERSVLRDNMLIDLVEES